MIHNLIYAIIANISAMKPISFKTNSVLFSEYILTPFLIYIKIRITNQTLIRQKLMSAILEYLRKLNKLT
nr:MAG TPA: hypothetical protein [Caudoviricetes sp.]